MPLIADMIHPRVSLSRGIMSRAVAACTPEYTRTGADDSGRVRAGGTILGIEPLNVLVERATGVRLPDGGAGNA